MLLTYLPCRWEEGPSNAATHDAQQQRDIDNEGEGIVSVENIKHWGQHAFANIDEEGGCVCVCVCEKHENPAWESGSFFTALTAL